MILQLLPEQISIHWDVIKYSIEQSLPPQAGTGPDLMQNILQSLLTGDMQCWLVVKDGDTPVVEAVATTAITEDMCTKVRSALIFSLFGFSSLTKEIWKEGTERIGEWAKSMGCTQIIAYSANPQVIQMSKMFRADISQTFINIQL